MQDIIILLVFTFSSKQGLLDGKYSSGSTGLVVCFVVVFLAVAVVVVVVVVERSHVSLTASIWYLDSFSQCCRCRNGRGWGKDPDGQNDEDAHDIFLIHTL